jgi:hypothetical protein
MSAFRPVNVCFTPRKRTLELSREALGLWAAHLMKLVTVQPKPKAAAKPVKTAA